MFRILLVLAAFAVVPAEAQHETLLREGGSITGLSFPGGGDAEAVTRTYIVQLKSPGAAEFHARQLQQQLLKSGTSAAAAGFEPFSRSLPSVQSHAQRLAVEQETLLAKIGTGSERVYSYLYSMNGMAVRMTEAQAAKAADMEEVLHVWEDEIRPLATNFSPEFLRLFDARNGLRGALGLDGEDVVIGVIDSGIVPEHPALSDTVEAFRPRACRSNWGRSSLLGRWLCRPYRNDPDRLVYEPPEGWNGTCQPGPEFTADACNNKLIGARYFFDGAVASGPIDDGEIFSARDVDGHGTHTATTAAGNKVNASIFGTFLGRVEGMAPRARVAAYKACWLRPGETRASCNTSDLALAIDTAVADGVDVINYSVGNTRRDVTAPDDVALMGATTAGVLAVVAGGNDGPNLGTIGSPAGAPWVITAAASSRDGEHALEALEVTAPPSVSGRYAVKEASFTPPLEDSDPIEADLVLVDDEEDVLPDGSPGTTFDACEPIVNDSDVSGNVALIQRGGCTFRTKVENAEAAGAVAAVVINIAGDPIVMTGTSGTVEIPALMIGQADGNLLLAEIDADETVSVVLDKGLFLTVDDTGNVMGTFSSRGPGPVPDILKPDVTAPGINILAGFTPDAANSVGGEQFGFLTGTSMSTPHVAGVAALLRQAHPEWSPAALKSALMTTAYQDVRQQDGETAANPFDFGAGHIDPNAAAAPGLVFEITREEYDAYACGIGSPAVSAARCEDLGARGLSFRAADLNQPAISVSRLASARTVSRRVTNPGDTTETYAVEVDAPGGIAVSVDPPMLSLGPGQSATYDVTLTYLGGPLDLFRFGSLTWESVDHRARTPLAVRPISLTAPAEVASFGGTGTLSFPVEFGYSGPYSPRVHGLRLPLVLPGFVDADPQKTFTPREVNGVTAHVYTVPADQAYLRFALFDELTDGDDDLDLYVYYCPDGVNCTRLGESGGETSEEEVNVFSPGAGTYVAFVHGFEPDPVAGGPGANYEIVAWQFGNNDDQGNMTVSAPSLVSAGATVDVEVGWNGLLSNTIYLGGISHNTPQGLAGLTIVRIRN